MSERASEAALIARFFAPLAGAGARGLRDDAASLTPTPGHDLVVTTDALVAGIHFFPDDPPASIAVKALGVNLSDLAAKGAAPRGYVLSLMLADDWTEAWLAAFAEGLRQTGARHACPLLGGDTVRTEGPLTLSLTAFGEVPTGTMVPRQGARPGDVICVSGTIGDAALGLALRLGKAGAAGLDAASRSVLLDRYLHPRPRLALAPILSRHARTAMDVSDGLAGDLAKMLGAGMTARVRLADVPLSEAARTMIAADSACLETALTGGDDYEILCAVAPDNLAAFLAAAREADVQVTPIGVFAEGEGAPVFVSESGDGLVFEKSSYSHF